MRRTTVLSITAFLILALAAFAQAPAGATIGPRKLPKGNKMYTIPCNTAPSDYHLHRVNASTAAFTSIGGHTNINGSNCAYGMAFNPKSGKSYFIPGNTTDGTWPIASVNLATGREKYVSTITVTGTPSTDFPAVIAISNRGKAFSIVGNNLYKQNITTGNATLIGATGVTGTAYAFAFNPKDKKFYAVTDVGHVYRINLTTGAGTFLGTVPILNNNVYSLTFATNGLGWINEGGPDVTDPPRIGSFQVSDPAGTLVSSSGPMTFYSGAFEVTY